mgnify:CR=1 FL=1
MSTLSFLLCADRSAARRVRRHVATLRPGLGLVVGSWPELLEHVRSSYLLDVPEESWSSALQTAASQMDGAFWARSLSLAETETLDILDRELRRLVHAVGPEGVLQDIETQALSVRGQRHYAELAELHAAMGYSLPPELVVIGDVLKADPDTALRPVRVYTPSEGCLLDPWQQALVDELNRRATSLADDALQALFDAALQRPSCTDQTASLSVLQNHLYQKTDRVSALDASLQWMAVRDYLQEAEVAAGMIQQLRDSDSDTELSEIGLLLPSNQIYAQAIHDVFGRSGLPLSGLSRHESVRDLGHEFVFYLLKVLKRPAPTMSLAALLCSPLLSWGREAGLVLSQAVMDGNFRLEKMAWPPNSAPFLSAVVKGADTTEAALHVLAEAEKLLDPESPYPAAIDRAREGLATATTELKKQRTPIWDELLTRVTPQSQTRTIEGPRTREGITVFAEAEEPWRSVRQLFVLGFNAGHYPRNVGGSAVFSAADLEMLRSKSALAIETPGERAELNRQLFVRQLECATEKIHFLLSRRQADGTALAPAASLTFMAQLFGADEPEELICELETDTGRNRAAGLSLAQSEPPVLPRVCQVSDLNLGSDLLARHKKKDGTLYPMSPSRLETLMVSPLAWVLGRSGLEPREWAPEELDVASKGTLAHAVFEWLFPVGTELPTEAEIRKRVPGLLNQAIMTIKPFLLGPEWQVERNHLENETLVAALRWRALLDQLGARVVGAEVWLEGELEGIPLHGAADLLLGLPDGRLFVVDYKKSKSKKRKERMQAAYDSQASLYRIMLETGGVKSEQETGTAQAIRQAKEIGVLYYLLNDQVVLTDTDSWLQAGLDDIEELAGDVSSQALQLIRQRLVEMQNGRVRLNRADDEKWYDKNAGIKLYALDNSPLLRLFMHPVEGEDA